MTITFKSRAGDPIAEVDSDSIISDRIKVTMHACPVCAHEPVVGRDSGCWYLVGTPGCAACGGTYALPDEAELTDILKRNK